MDSNQSAEDEGVLPNVDPAGTGFSDFETSAVDSANRVDAVNALNTAPVFEPMIRRPEKEQYSSNFFKDLTPIDWPLEQLSTISRKRFPFSKLTHINREKVHNCSMLYNLFSSDQGAVEFCKFAELTDDALHSCVYSARLPQSVVNIFCEKIMLYKQCTSNYDRPYSPNIKPIDYGKECKLRSILPDIRNCLRSYIAGMEHYNPKKKIREANLAADMIAFPERYERSSNSSHKSKSCSPPPKCGDKIDTNDLPLTGISAQMPTDASDDSVIATVDNELPIECIQVAPQHNDNITIFIKGVDDVRRAYVINPRTTLLFDVLRTLRADHIQDGTSDDEKYKYIKLIHNNEILQDSRRFKANVELNACYDACNHVDKLRPNTLAEKIKIYVQGPHCTVVYDDVSTLMDISELKHKVSEDLKIDKTTFCLRNGYKVITTGSLHKNNVFNDSRLSLMCKFKGGHTAPNTFVMRHDIRSLQTSLTDETRGVGAEVNTNHEHTRRNIGYVHDALIVEHVNTRQNTVHNAEATHNVINSSSITTVESVNSFTQAAHVVTRDNTKSELTTTTSTILEEVGDSAALTRTSVEGVVIEEHGKTCSKIETVKTLTNTIVDDVSSLSTEVNMITPGITASIESTHADTRHAISVDNAAQHDTTRSVSSSNHANVLNAISTFHDTSAANHANTINAMSTLHDNISALINSLPFEHFDQTKQHFSDAASHFGNDDEQFLESFNKGLNLLGIPSVSLTHPDLILAVDKLKTYLFTGRLFAIHGSSDVPGLDSSYHWPSIASIEGPDVVGLYFRTQESNLFPDTPVYQYFRIDSYNSGSINCTEHVAGEPALPRPLTFGLSFDNQTDTPVPMSVSLMESLTPVEVDDLSPSGLTDLEASPDSNVSSDAALLSELEASPEAM